MKGLIRIQAVLVALTAIFWGFAYGQVPQLINYQGMLIDPGTGQPIPDDTYTMVFSIYNSKSPLVTPVWTETHSVETNAGAYNVMLGSNTPLTTTIFSGPEKYLGIKIGSDPEMTPRRQIVSVAYSFIAGSVSGASNTFPSDGNVGIGTTTPTCQLEVADTIFCSAGGYKFPDGSVQITAATGGGGNNWSLTGNSGTTPGTNFLGTLDDQALEIKVNSARALRVEPSPGGSADWSSPNFIGGHSANSAKAGVAGATIGGGGSSSRPNYVSDSGVTIGGGYNNQAGNDDSAMGNSAYATVAGGVDNTASWEGASIGGGKGNTASAIHATVSGGINNTASASYSTVPGGWYNTASGLASFAAGYKANAQHPRSFVWSSTTGGASSTANDQFVISAHGGVGTTDNWPLDFIVNSERALRLEPISGPGTDKCPNIIGGYANNTVLTGVMGATISGGGFTDAANQVTDHFGTIGGGQKNQAGDNAGYYYDKPFATVGGGFNNIASGEKSMVPGGASNTALGTLSFAAGYRAKALHPGSFVWGDSSEADIASTNSNQFLIRASGGVGIGTNSPSSLLEVAGIIHSSFGGYKFPDGTVQTTAATGGGGDGWSLTGNSGTTPGTNFLGTTDNAALEIKVDNKRALRIEPIGLSPNIIGGHAQNSITSDVRGAVIGGGGATGSAPYAPNRVTDNYGTISGGYANQAGDDDDNISNMPGATVGGGIGNTASGWLATISGGQYNIASGNRAAIAGGLRNEASGYDATVGGGEDNIASGDKSTIPGGKLNATAGMLSFATGYRAKANHNGTFVWADYQDADFASTSSNQFLIRASGGVGIGTSTPDEQLTVNGNTKVSGDIIPQGKIVSPDSIVIQSSGSYVVVLAGTNKITVDPSGGVTIESDYIELKSTGTLKLSGMNVDIEAVLDMNLNASYVDIQSTVNTKLKANELMDIDGGGQVDIDGNQVTIN